MHPVSESETVWIVDMIPNKKRDSRQYIVINEERLINEVQQRPILYDKALKGYRKPTIREHAWQEVATLLESTVDESKKRWRSLRDAFMKQYKQFAADEPSTVKKKKWLFYDQMEFLRPYLEGKDEYFEETIEAKHHVVKRSSGGSYSDDVKQRIIKSNIIRIEHHSGNTVVGDDSGGIGSGGVIIGDGDEEEEEQLLEEHEEVIDMYEDRDIISEMFSNPVGTSSSNNTSSGGSHEPQQTHTILTHHPSQPPQLQHHSSTNHHHHHHQQQHTQISATTPTASNSSHNQNADDSKEQNVEIASISTYGLDPDERFLLSCAPILKRLSHKKNGLARLKMQQILYNIEFGESTY